MHGKTKEETTRTATTPETTKRNNRPYTYQTTKQNDKKEKTHKTRQAQTNIIKRVTTKQRAEQDDEKKGKTKK